ncbi:MULTISPECIES: YajQ family cyclic di-GMP-binding protein [unclassified Shewanella]|uniref:YajQ family cyclic di-GMP-binding protein n=1 Tax=unclassified Shewanella TaxID=196818 RepID=UPI000C847AB5|nr:MULTISPECIES: YajQ family cyclic di-GMP-binding protein [unclassified Shewanella]MDO6619155.1 YajQ family cyclic di-GMP-binding protein [Shewanella sp. 6_MG-2023]MDO6641338.1 YajQ family cyclic di-GMP-binding protein [Shewanella sp. 5_MG-2023]MDO6773937.1 YajQ family cyclic di-GMP-binding protein [Shewanella sp. 3_MG-2023]PMG31635.1 YajQ family cyclic di-GMP-binding protein [Shewanella sp. 10N.286.52.C2]PMG39797.1 YajQ family cyclic di-GMP-binding protein [Shewanella sp. 10N.286.52.B9]
MPSMDVVSEVDEVELRNAVENSRRELAGRFDFRGKDAEIEYKDHVVTLKAEDDFQCQQLVDILRIQLSKRNVDPSAMDVDDKTVHSGKTFSLKVKFKEGIETLIAKKLVKAIKDSKLKVQAAIQGDSVRVTGKKRDDLQAVMRLTKEADLGQPFQFNNFRD